MSGSASLRSDAASRRSDPITIGVILILFVIMAGFLLFRKPKPHQESPLFLAVQHNARSEVEALLGQGVPVNVRRKVDAATPLIVAADKDESLIRLLLDRGADVNMKDADGDTPLLKAMEALVRDVQPPNPFTIERGKFSPDKRLAIIRLLLERGANINAENNGGITALIRAISTKRLDIVSFLLEHGADARQTTMAGSQYSSIEGGNAMCYAAQYGTLDILKRLVQAGAEVDLRNVKQATALILAANWGHGKCVDYLLQQGADVHARTMFGDTALLQASRTAGKFHDECVRLLLKAKADANMRNPEGETPLLVAAQAGGLETMSALLQAGARVDDRRYGKPKPLPVYHGKGTIPLRGLANVPSDAPSMSASASGMASAGSLSPAAAQSPPAPVKDSPDTLAKPSPTAAKRPSTSSAAFDRARRGMRYFSVEGDTPLFYAAMYGRLEAARLLLAHGAKVDARNELGETPLDIAEAHDQPEMAELLRGEK